MDSFKIGRTVLFSLAAALVIALAYQVVNRLLFPWDNLIWPESPFLTNMWKLHAGHPVYTDPADANGVPYSPGLEYLTFALLAPFGVELDIRFCRIIVVLLGVGAAFLGARFSARWFQALTGASGDVLVFRRLAFLILLLLIFKSFTSDVCHPDNLHLFHFTAVLSLGFLTIATGRFRWAAVTVVVAGIGFLAKQAAALGVVGVIAFFAFEYARTWGRRRTLALALAGLVVTGGAVWVVVGGSAYGRLHAIDLNSVDMVGGASLAWAKVPQVLSGIFREYPHRILLYVAAIISVWSFAFHENAVVRRALRLWLFVGVTEALPGLVAFFKTLGWWNNLVVIDLWAAMIAIPGLYHFAAKPAFSAWTVPSFVAFISLLLFTLTPFKRPPGETEVNFMTEVEASLRSDLRMKRKVLVSHGTSVLLRAGAREIPLDRANSFMDFNLIGRAEITGTRRRIENLYYERIYLVAAGWYGHEVLEAIHRNYEEVDRIRLPPSLFAWETPRPYEWFWGFQPHLWTDVPIFAPREACLLDEAR